MPESQPTLNGRPYHHGNLRATLLVEAERTLREQGVAQVSLRDLARQAGVSHGAPSRHFRDRQALLDALAVVGYDRLGDELAAAVQDAGAEFEARLRAAAATYIRFALDNAALLELMLSAGRPDRCDEAPKIYGRPYVILRELIQYGDETGELRPGDPECLQLLILATLQGIAALVGSGGVAASQADELVAEAAALFTRSR